MKILPPIDRFNGSGVKSLRNSPELNVTSDKNQRFQITIATPASNTDEKEYLETCYRRKSQANMQVKILAMILMLFPTFFSPYTFAKLDKELTKKSRCPQEVLDKLDKVNTQFHPYEIVVKPWKGRHNVHGIYMLPVDEDNLEKTIGAIHIPGAGTFCGGVYKVGTSFQGIQAKPGYHFVKSNLRTRTSIWLIMRGFTNQLKDSGNWKLVNYQALAPAKLGHQSNDMDSSDRAIVES
jgi:hypothetical protein